MFQLTMAYAYWKAGKHEQEAVFDLFFRKNPFGGEFTIFAGLGEVIKYLDTFHFEADEIEHLKTVMPVPPEDAEFFGSWRLLLARQIVTNARADGVVGMAVALIADWMLRS